MSDDESFEVDDDEEEDEEEGETPIDVEIENTFYESEANMNKPETALKGFKKVLALEEQKLKDDKKALKGEFGFNSTKYIIRLMFGKGEFKEMMVHYKSLLSYAQGTSLTRNASEKGLNDTLDWLNQQGATVDLIQEIYQVTLDALAAADNQKLWFKTLIKLGNVYLSTREVKKLEKLIRDAHKYCRTDDGKVDPAKAAQYLEVNALEISLYSELDMKTKQAEVYDASLKYMESVVCGPRVLGIIQECGGKMFMRERNWESSNKCFFDAFTNYNDAGDSRKIQCLKYLVLSSMLQENAIDPFGAQETMPFKQNKEIEALTNLCGCYGRLQLKEFEKTLKQNHQSIMGDTFIAAYIGDITRKLRIQVLLKLIKPYVTIDLNTLCVNLYIKEDEVVELLVSLILDCQLNGRIDQVNKRLILASKGKMAASDARYSAIDHWTRQCRSVHHSVMTKVQ